MTKHLKVLSEEHKKKIGLTRLGKKHSSETRKKMSQAQTGKKHAMFGKHHSLESRLKISNKVKKEKHPFWGKKGEQAPNWRGGATTILGVNIRNTFNHRQWRSDVFYRDNYTCQDCGSRGVTLNADHIKPFSLILKENEIDNIEKAIVCAELWNINNGRTLCVPCHRKTDTYGGRAKN